MALRKGVGVAIEPGDTRITDLYVLRPAWVIFAKLGNHFEFLIDRNTRLWPKRWVIVGM